MNSKMTTNSQLSTTEPQKKKKELNEQLEQDQNHRNGDHMDGCQWGGGRGRIEEKVQGIRSINGRYKIDGEVKNSTRNGEAKERMYDPWT